MNDLDRRPTLEEIDSIYDSAIIEFLEEKTEWFQKEKDHEVLINQPKGLKAI
jgi:hypothetical protein